MQKIDDIILSLSNLEISSLSLFIASAVAGMVFAYYRKWSWSEIDKPLWIYLTGDKHATGRALTTLVLMCGAAGSLDYLNSLTDIQIVIAAAGIGYMVPSTIEQQTRSEIGK